jgi:hypothetical protein
MKKYGLRIFVGLIAFLIGVNSSIAWTFSDRETVCERGKIENVEILLEKSKELEFVSNRKKTGKVEIYFNGFNKATYAIYGEIEIVNNSSHTIYFIGDSEYTIFPQVELNRIKGIKEAHCGGTVFNEFPFHSGEVIRAKIPLSKMGYITLQKRNEFRVGYYFREEREKESKIFWSEKNHLPEWVQELKKYSK